MNKQTNVIGWWWWCSNLYVFYPSLFCKIEI